MYKKSRLLSFTMFALISCMKPPSASITDKYMEVINPGQILGLIELGDVTIDSLLEYPIQETPKTIYTIIDRKMNRAVGGNIEVKMYFDKKSEEYCWKVEKYSNEAEYYYTDTINLNVDSWYKLSTEKYGFDIYFFINGKTRAYQTKLKAHPGAY